MKLKKKITAAFAAFAMMFTLTDPAALGSVLNSSGIAFAKAAIGDLELKSTLQQPVAGESFWGVNAAETNQSQYILETNVNWYLDGDPTNTPVTTNAGYNKRYRVEIKYRINTSNYSIPASGVTVYYPQGTNLVPMTTRVEGDEFVIAEHTFAATRLPNTTGVEFEATASIPAHYSEITLDPSPAAHTTNAQLLGMLPTTALITTEDADLTLRNTITWKTSTGSFDFATSDIYDPNGISEQSFKLRGTVTVPSGSAVGDTTTKYYVYVNVKVLAADQLPPPTTRTPEGEYNTGLRVILSSSETIYYTISENDKGPDPQGGVETETNFKYNGFINLAGVVGTTKTYYIKAVAFNSLFNTSEVAIFKYSITLEPSELTNIPTVHLDVDPPVGGEVLDTTAELSSNATDLERGGISVISSVAWVGSNLNGKADYNSRYSISIEITPKNMYAFFSTPSVFINGKPATSFTNPSGSLTITYTFPEKTAKLSSFKIVAPSSVVTAENGTSIGNIGKLLPTLVELEAPVGTLLEKQYPVTWDLSSSSPSYDPKKSQVQEFTLTGTVALPEYIEYSQGQNVTTVKVYVGEAGTLTWPTAYPADSAEGGRAFYEETEVTLTCANANAAIYYTIGTDPDLAAPTVSGGKAYTVPIKLAGSPGEIVTYYIKAIATAAGMKDSPVNTFVYTVIIPKKTCAAPTANYASGTYQQSLNLALNTTTVGAEIYYTTDPTAAITAFQKYTGVIQLEGLPNSTKVFNIRCYATDPSGKMNDSDLVQFNYTLALPKNAAIAPTPDKTPGISYEEGISVALSTSTPNTEIRYVTGVGSILDPAKGQYGTKYTKAISLKYVKNDIITYTIKTYAKSLDPNVDDSPVVTYTFTIGLEYNVTKIEIVTRPSKYSYFLGELINVSGGVIKVTYKDGTTENVLMDDDMIDDFDSWYLGQQTVKVYYKGCYTFFNVVVRKKSSDTSSDTKDDSKKDDTKKDDTTKDDTSKDNTTTTPDTSTDGTVSPPTMKGSAVKGWDQLLLKVKAATAESRLVIYLNGNTSVPADIINAAAKKKATLEFVVNDAISWVIDAGKIGRTVASVSVGVKTKDVYIPSVLIDNAGESEVVRIHTYGDNKTGAMLYVKTGCNEKNHFVNLFRYNDTTNQLDFISTSKVTPSTGIAQVTPAAGGDYVLMLDTKTRLPGDADNSTTIDARDAAAILKMIIATFGIDDTCDFNGDGFVNALDAADILKSIVGIL